jgi:hypothetical protein
MPIIVKYNDDINFRRKVAFRRVYRGRNFGVRAGSELAVMLLCVIATILLIATPVGREMPVLALYISAMIGLYLLVRFIRTILMVSRIKPGDEERAGREFCFDENGFSFGPLDSDGTLIETRWMDVDRVYIDKGVMYILCMSRRHWAAVDRRLMVEGSWGELLALMSEKLPKNKLVK